MVAEGSATSRSLILACSRRKRTDEGLLPAVDRYDGPAFRVLRRFLREGSSEVPDIRVLSAEHGLIPHDLPIANYDRIMTDSRARELRPHVIAEMSRVMDALRLRDVFILAGRVYLSALSSEKMPFSLAAV